MGKKVYIAAAIIIFICLAGAVNIVNNRGAAAIPVQTATVEKKEIEDSVPATGRVRLVEKQEVYAENAATIKKIYVRPGDRVSSGQLLVALDDGDTGGQLEEARASLELQEADYRKALANLPIEKKRLSAGVDRAEADLSAARSKYDRYKLLFAQGAVSAQDLETAEVDLKNSLAGLEEAQANFDEKNSGSIPQDEMLSLKAVLAVARAQYEEAIEKYDCANLKAQMDGIVFTVEVSEGDSVDPRTRLITIGNPERLELALNIDEGDSGKVRPGQRAEITAAAMPDLKFSGTVTEVSPGALTKDNGRGGVSVEIPVVISIDGSAKGLRPGYTADVSIITTEKKVALVVPYEAVVEKGDKKYVFLADSARARQVEIKTGFNTELYTEVTGGLKEGDRVIVNPGDKIKDGDTLREIPGIDQDGGGGGPQ